jgi:hypothetical protein
LASLEPRRARIVERLAFRMYEAGETSGIPWLRRGWTVRAAWLKAAQESLQAGSGLAGRRMLWWNGWGRARSMR